MSGGALPPPVAAVLAARLEGVPRAPLKAAVAATSLAYRAAGTSAHAIRSATDALAYALVRMPATTTTVGRAIAEAARRMAPLQAHSLLDIGAGTGAATLAALDAWPQLERLHLVELNPHLAALAADLLAAVGDCEIQQSARDATQGLPADYFDVVLMSYVQVEWPLEVAARLVASALSRARQVLVLVEPGTTAGFARIRAARDIVHAAGWSIAAPCPHADGCPLQGEDWCHFKARLARSRDHRLLKDGDAPYEDEPYSYLVATPLPVTRPEGRILTASIRSKSGITLDLCTPQGRRVTTVSKRDGPAFKVARRLDAGDAFEPPR